MKKKKRRGKLRLLVIIFLARALVKEHLERSGKESASILVRKLLSRFLKRIKFKMWQMLRELPGKFTF